MFLSHKGFHRLKKTIATIVAYQNECPQPLVYDTRRASNAGVVCDCYSMIIGVPKPSSAAK